MKIYRSNIAPVIRLFIVGIGVLLALCLLTDDCLTAVGRAETESRRAPGSSRQVAKFSHLIAQHQKECASCHHFPSSNWKAVRSGDMAFPDVTDFPTHESCLNCHRPQFFTGRPPQICSVCHQMASPDGGERYPFSNPREVYDRSARAASRVSAFAVFFPHNKHVGIVSENQKPLLNGVFLAANLTPQDTSCAVCHSTIGLDDDSANGFVSAPPKGWGIRFWPQTGSLKSSPTGHQQCFTCHAPEGGISPAPADCAMCHKPREKISRADLDPRLPANVPGFDREMRLITNRRIASGRFRHGFAVHAAIECSTCHTVETIDTVSPEKTRVSIGACVMCHVTATVAEGGGLNIELEKRKANRKFDCSICHISFGRLPVPESHIKAVTGN